MGDTSRMYFVGSAPILAPATLGDLSRKRCGGASREVKAGWRAWGDYRPCDPELTPKATTFRVVREYCGTRPSAGVYHEDPQVLHYGKGRGTGLELTTGMTFHHRTHDQRPAAATSGCCPTAGRWSPKDQSLSAQWEHTILVTDGRLRGAHAKRGPTRLSRRCGGPLERPQHLPRSTLPIGPT